MAQMRRALLTRKVRLTPLQGAVLRVLEEAHEETVSTLLASIGRDDRSSPAFVSALDSALQGLVQLGYIHVQDAGFGHEQTASLLQPGIDALRR